jgi:hypothetical protein
MKLYKSYLELKCITKQGSAVVHVKGINLPVVIDRKSYNNILKCRGVYGKMDYIGKYNVFIFTQDKLY